MEWNLPALQLVFEPVEPAKERIVSLNPHRMLPVSLCPSHVE
jgi:hypothetical protein